MIKVQFHIGKDGKIRGFQVKGHAGYADHGRDIVCAAVSALAQTAVLGLTKVAGLTAKVDSREGFLECLLDEPAASAPSVPQPAGSDPEARARANDRARAEDLAQTILQTLILGLTDIQKDYSQYLSIKS